MMDNGIQNFIKQLQEIGDGITIGTKEFDELCHALISGYQSVGHKYYFSIDLLQSKLRQYYSSTGETNAYREIRNFFKEKGFSSRKDTNYISDEYITKFQVDRIIQDLNKTFPWLVVSASKFDITEMDDARAFNGFEMITQIATIDKSLEEIKEMLQESIQDVDNKYEIT